MSHRDFLVSAEVVLSRALELEQARVGQVRAFDALSARVGAGMVRWLGPDGWEALLTRARLEHADADDLHRLVAIAGILSRLIGGELTLVLLRQASEHPDDPPAGGPLG
jgi:hypothetical protein